MQWFILLLLVPAVLGSVIALIGFAGCEAFSAGPETISKPLAPSNFNATGTGEKEVTLSWQNNAVGITQFTVHREDASGTVEFTTGPNSPPDTTVSEGVVYTYKVKALGAAGTGNDSDWSGQKKATTFPSAPTGVTASATDLNSILVNWTSTSSHADHYIIHDHPTSGGVDTFTAPVPFAGATQQVPAPVAPGSAHEFSVMVTVDGWQNVDPLVNVPSTPVPSAPSAAVPIKPLAFKADLTTTPPGNPDGNPAGFAGFTIVQVFHPAALSNNGAQVKLTLHGPDGATLRLDKITLSQQATGAAADPWDSAADLMVFATNVVLPPNDIHTIGPFGYNLDRTKDLLVGFDINPASDKVRRKNLPGVAVTAYSVEIDPPEAAVKDRADGAYNEEPETVYLIERIEVI